MVSLLLLCAFARADPPLPSAPLPSAAALDAQRVAVARPAMWTLGAWSVANIGVGTVGALTASDEQWRAFHSGNAAWNTVNLGIAGLSLWGLSREQPGDGGLAGALERAHGLDVALALNTGLDVAYVTAGAWLWERGQRLGDPQQVGLGQSLVLQGGALLVFDATVLTLHRRATTLRPAVSLAPGGGSVGAVATF